MSKKAFSITASESNGIARIEIIGNIHDWNENSAGNFRSKIRELVSRGVNDAHIYINSGGGDCFQANEIENILREFKGKVTGEGGALVASAASYLAVKIGNFALAENCQFMIHKPVASTEGTEQEIENRLKLLKNITEQYKAAYLAKTTMNEADFLAKWENGDFWMTAQEAKNNGFVSSVVQRVEVDETTARMIAACGCPSTPRYTTPVPSNSATYNGKTFSQLQAESPETLAHLEQTNPAKYEALFNAEYGNRTSNAIEARKYEGKTFEQLQNESPETLAYLEQNNPNLFNQLFNDYKRQNRL